MNDAFSGWRGGSSGTEADGWLQLLPYVADLGLALTGVPAENSFLDRTVECVISVAALTLITGTMKQFIESPRPIGDSRSFPSGHTGRVFTGAELVRMEYGWGWGAGAYAVAAAVGVMRMYNGAHWFSDVLAGAGIGILSAHIGRWLLDPAKRLFYPTPNGAPAAARTGPRRPPGWSPRWTRTAAPSAWGWRFDFETDPAEKNRDM